MQQTINEMYSGNTDAIISGVNSNNDYLVMNAILSGTKKKIQDERFIEGVQKARKSNVVLLGYPIKSVADASYYFLTKQKYDGDDEIVKTLLENEFNI